MKKELGIFLLLVALCAVTATINPRFLSQTNLTNMANLIGLFGVFSLGLGPDLYTQIGACVIKEGRYPIAWPMGGH